MLFKVPSVVFNVIPSVILQHTTKIVFLSLTVTAGLIKLYAFILKATSVF